MSNNPQLQSKEAVDKKKRAEELQKRIQEQMKLLNPGASVADALKPISIAPASSSNQEQQSLPKPAAAEEKRPAKVILDEKGNLVDEHGNIVPLQVKPVVTSLANMKHQQEKKPARKPLFKDATPAAAAAASQKKSYVPTREMLREVGAIAKQKRRTTALKFHEPW